MTGPIIVTALFAPGDDGWLQQMRRDHFPPERNQVPAHLTLFHHLAPSVEPELDRQLALAAAGPVPRAEIAGILDLGGGTAFRVESEELEEIRAGIADHFHGLLTPQDQAPWRPHITVQNKVEPREARALQQRLKAGFEPQPLALKGLATWRYQSGPWERMKLYAFRGLRR